MSRSIANTSARPVGKRSKGWKRLKIGCATAFILLSIVVMGATWYADQQLKKAASLVPSLPERMKRYTAERSVILSRDGEVMESISTEFRQPVKIEDVPGKVISATLAAEDKRFFQHEGVDFWAVGRAAFSTLTGHRTEGASTLTMQLAKRVFTSTSKTLDRKIEDMALATMIERKLTKEQILELYLNQVFYGSGAYGVSAAAQVYFGKSLDQLTWSEAATLARCVRRPSDENPFSNKRVALRNRDIVLGIMHDEGWIGDSDYNSALKEPLHLRKRGEEGGGTRTAPYFCDYVKQWVQDNCPDIDLSTGGYRIETTLDPKLQEFAEKKIREMVAKNRRLKITTAAFVLTDNEGRILAMVGGPDYNKNQFNVITQGHRQPGSSFKPLVYATAFEFDKLNPNGSVSNEPYFIPKDNGHGERLIRGGGKGGAVSVRTAIAKSINTCAMWAMKDVGLENVISTAHTAFGIKSDLPAAETIALGADEVTPLEMAAAYSVFQNKGDRFEPYGVVRIVGPNGQAVQVNGPTFHRRQLSPSSAEGIDTCLRAVVTGGTGTRAGSVTNARGKTGTTSSNKDAWFCGYTDKFLGVGWIANETRTADGRVRYLPMDDYVMGGHMVAPLWAQIVGQAQKLYGEEARHIKAPQVTITPDDATAPADEVNPGIDEKTSPQPDNPGDQAPPDQPGDIPPVVQGDGNDAPPSKGGPKKDGGTAEEGKIVWVEICADSGQRATIYCPERVRKAFKAGTEPKERCQLHKGPGG